MGTRIKWEPKKRHPMWIGEMRGVCVDILKLTGN